MATVRNIQLSMGRAGGGLESATLTFTVNFSQFEVQQNLAFGLYAALFERDDSLDTYHLNPNGAFSLGIDWSANGNRDDFIVWLESRVVRPNGDATRFFTITRTFNAPNNEIGPEEYRALVHVVPEVSSGLGWSNEVSINLA